jgi:hypothetical protein
VCILIFGCATNAIKDYKQIIYTSEFQTNSKEKAFENKTFKMSIPKGFTINYEDFNPEFKEVVYTYKNNIKIYITDNTFGGSALNGDNKLNDRITSINRKTLQDSIYMYGSQKDDNYWKENILNDIVVGYLNVPKERKEEFDQAIATIKREGNKAKQNLLHESIHSQKQ